MRYINQKFYCTMKELVKSESFGKFDAFSGSYDAREVYESHLLGLPTQIVICSGDVIDSVSFIYGEFELPVLGGNGGGKHVFSLRANEYIVKVSGAYTSNYFGASALTALSFYTNLGNIYGVTANSRAESHFEYEVPADKVICCLFGSRSEHTDGSVFVSTIGFYACEKPSVGVSKITCINNAGFIQKFRVLWDGGASDWSSKYPNPQSATIDLNGLNIPAHTRVWIEVDAILGRTKQSSDRVIYEPASANAAVYRTTGATLTYRIHLEG